MRGILLALTLLAACGRSPTAADPSDPSCALGANITLRDGRAAILWGYYDVCPADTSGYIVKRPTP